MTHQHLINQSGSVDDIKCSLSFIKQCTPQTISLLTNSLENERQNKNRATVIKMLEAKIKKLNK